MPLVTEFIENAVEQKAGSDQHEKLLICLPQVEFVKNTSKKWYDSLIYVKNSQYIIKNIKKGG